MFGDKASRDMKLIQPLVNKVKAVYGQVLIDNCVVEVAGGNSSIIDFNSGGAAEYVTIQNSTIYGNPQHTGQLYSSQSGTKATDAGMDNDIRHFPFSL